MLNYAKMKPLTTDEQTIVVDNIGLVGFYVKRWMRITNDRYDPDDLTQCGTMGLMRSAKSWNPEKGKLSTYSAMEINRAIQSWIIGDNTIKPSESKALVANRISKKMARNPELTYESEEIRQMYQRYSAETVKRMVESPTYIPVTKIDRGFISASERVGSTSCNSLDIGTGSPYDKFPDDKPTPDEITEQKQIVGEMLRKIELIPLARPFAGAKLPRDMKRIVLRECYLGERTLESVGKEYGVTREWIRQVRDEALTELRRMMT